MELNKKMYYSCSLCSTEHKVAWHRPKKKTWEDHKQYIDLDQTNSETPQYFWCLKHNRPHSLKRECLTHKATITLNGSEGYKDCTTKQLSHNDALDKIRKTVTKKSNQLDWKKVMGSNSLPYPCTRESRLILPDIIYCLHDPNTNSAFSITNIIEFETKTTPETVIDKVKRFDKSFEEMIIKNYHGHILPRIIFLYDKETEVSLTQIQNMLNRISFKNLESVCIGYYDIEDNWYIKYFMKI
ncbi:hypothetical protein Mzhil_1288 [Methanosalsum zhilinae DSM 4017]|uniref:Uncharacterized protein n=1 Tax=Methanosalsum zhilinae (strain DSM 4017 / NBRC 107636 / OCM 62 / WeN5) TaxID=679901 RepID=F7XN30_METZD|nr:hypothetical protein [Methanosalsum zhilinae]AEH61142.1 hypothetical protein Mzhil_1288 [Methanosalsum zhilinae DSM 4017]